MKSFKEFISEESKGINVRSDPKAGRSYADLIVDGKKKMETRDNDRALKSCIGKRVSIIKTGEGKAHAIGEVTVGEPQEVGEEEFRRRESEHLVPEKSDFDIKPGKTKHMYPMINPVRYDKPRRVAQYGMGIRKVFDEE